MELTKGIIQDIVACATVATMEALGVTSGHISQRKAEEIYGSWFKEMVRRGKLKPSSVGDGKNGTRRYSVRDILALRAEDKSKASLETKYIMSKNN